MSLPLIWCFEIFSWLCWQSQKMQGIYIIFIHIQSPLKASGLNKYKLFWIKHIIVMHVILINIWHLWLWFLLPCLLTVITYRRRLSFHSKTSTQYLFSKLLHTTSQWESTQLGEPSCLLHGVLAIQIAIQRLMNTEANGRHSRRSMVSSNNYFTMYGQNTGTKCQFWG